MKIGLITPMTEEAKFYHEHFKIEKEIVKTQMTFYKASFNNLEVIFVKCGIGKVHAAICTQILIDDFKVDKIICTGVAGSLNPSLNIGDVVVSVDCAHHDMKIEFLNLPRGQIPYTNLRFFKGDKEMIKLASEVDIESIEIVKGRILTGDDFVNNLALIETLKKDLEGDCVEMEGAAVGQTCVLNKKPFVIIRSISDDANHKAPDDFKEFLHEASENAYKVVIHILENLK